MKNGYLVTSAINTRFGAFSPSDRLAQTLETINSIKERDPEGLIIILEMAGKSLKPEHKKSLTPEVFSMIEFNNDPTVREIYLNENWDLVKNATEMLCFGRALIQLSKIVGLNDITRWFKVSGRYQLTDDFNLSQYSDPALVGKVVISKRRESQFDPKITHNNIHQYMTRLWSFDASLTTEIALMYVKMLNYMIEIVKAKGYVDIEHCLFRFLDQLKVVEVDSIGITGMLGPNSQTVKD